MEKNMDVNFDFLKGRVVDALEHTDLDYINYELSNISGTTVFSGVGGSNVVSEFGSKIVNIKNGVFSINSEPRDFLYRPNNGIKNVVACSYSGNNYGVKLSFLKSYRKYLLSNTAFNDKTVVSLTYNTTIDKERSFVSLAGTLIPVSVLMNYYINGNYEVLLDCIFMQEFNFDMAGDIYEIFSGFDTSGSAKFLESTMVESGIGLPIIHDKYSYCHGRSTLSKNYNSTAVYYNRNTDFDRMMLEELKKYYGVIITIDTKFDEQVLDDYQMLIQSMYLVKYIAMKKRKDLSNVDYSDAVKKLYKYDGQI